MDIYSEKKAMKDLNSLYAEAVYGKPKTAGQELAKRKKDDDAFGAPNKKQMVVTRADKKANTPAYQNYKKGDKRYTAADHLKNEEYGELYADVYNELQEKQKDTPDQVKAVIAFDKARKGTDDATYDSEHVRRSRLRKNVTMLSGNVIKVLKMHRNQVILGNMLRDLLGRKKVRRVRNMLT